MMKLEGRWTVQKSRPSSDLGVIAPCVHTPKNLAFGYDIGKIHTGCPVLFQRVETRLKWFQNYFRSSLQLTNIFQHVQRWGNNLK